MNYKKATAIGALCAIGALAAPQKADAGIVYVVQQPTYTTTYTAPVTYTTTPVITQPIVTQQVIAQPIYTTTYNNGYYNGYYDAMNKRWWYNNSWCYTRPRILPPPPPPRVYGGYCGGYYMPRYNHCAPAPRHNHCAPIMRPRFNHCAPPRINHCPPRGGFHPGRGPRGGRCW